MFLVLYHSLFNGNTVQICHKIFMAKEQKMCKKTEKFNCPTLQKTKEQRASHVTLQKTKRKRAHNKGKHVSKKKTVPHATLRASFS